MAEEAFKIIVKHHFLNPVLTRSLPICKNQLLSFVGLKAAV